jgi:4-diphosphocytidyl-2C-methyl-D-erythritol kinase
MFSKLNTEIRKQSIKEKSEVLFSNDKERKLFEQKLIFGDLLENLVSLDIEAGYKFLSEEEISMTPEMIQKKQEEEKMEDSKKELAKIDQQIAQLKADQESKKADLQANVLSNTQQIQSQIDSLEQKKQSL